MSSEQDKALPPGLEVPWTEPNGIYATYDMHCHCGAIRWTMKLSPPLYKEQTQGKEQCVAVDCNCSYCERKGYIGVHPLAKDVEFTQGLEHRASYYFGAKNNAQWFCRKCGCSIGTDLTYLMTEVLGLENRCTIDVRMLKDYDPDRLKIRPITFMKDMAPKYEV